MRIRDDAKIILLKEAALAMIVEEGFKGLSMQKLARKAGISPATIYIYFEDRDDLLHKLYIEVIDRSNLAALKKFSPDMAFAEGLEVLWLNRFRYFTMSPNDFFFIQQFINSPLVAGLTDQEDETYRIQMRQFHSNAIRNNEIAKLPLEVYWTIAYAPLYQLITFHLNKPIHPAPNMIITESKLITTLQLVLKSLKK